MARGEIWVPTPPNVKLNLPANGLTPDFPAKSEGEGAGVSKGGLRKSGSAKCEVWKKRKRNRPFFSAPLKQLARRLIGNEVSS